jgi:hypothetical protein
MQPNPIPPFHHGQISVNSSLLQLRVSFHWQPVINNDVVNMIRQWIDPPNFIFLSNLFFCTKIRNQKVYICIVYIRFYRYGSSSYDSRYRFRQHLAIVPA